jgi:hypothetical protein
MDSLTVKHILIGAISMQRYFTLMICSSLPLLLSGCPLERFLNRWDNGLGTLNNAIDTLEQQSGRWEDVLKETRDKLFKEGQSTLANEVSNVISRASGDAGIEVRCSADFLRDRAKEELISLRATITKETVELKPVFCKPVPYSIDMNLEDRRRNQIDIDGYNLTKDSVKVFLKDRKLKDLRDVSDKLSNPSSYLLTLNLGSNGVRLSTHIDKIIFKPKSGGEFSVAVIQPAPARPKPQFLNSRIHVTGKIDMYDADFLSNGNSRSFSVDEYRPVQSSRNQSYVWERCVGGDVAGLLTSSMQLDKNTGVVSVQGNGRYFEGTCGNSPAERGNIPFNFTLRPGESKSYIKPLENEYGRVIYNLTFKNEG